MNLTDLQRGYLAIFAAREAGPRASSDQMKAIAMCMRNRVRQGWENGDWLKVIQRAESTRANLGGGMRIELDIDDRDLQRFIREIDEIYFSRHDWTKEPSGDPMPSLDEAIGNAVFWAFINRPFTPWFEQNVLRDPEHHKMKTTMGLMMFYE